MYRGISYDHEQGAIVSDFGYPLIPNIDPQTAFRLMGDQSLDKVKFYEISGDGWNIGFVDCWNIGFDDPITIINAAVAAGIITEEEGKEVRKVKPLTPYEWLDTGN